MKLLQGRVAIIIGADASDGIGKEIAFNFAHHGANIVVAELNKARGAAAATRLQALGVRAKFIVTDIREPAAVEAAITQTFNEFDRIDILVNNAGPTIHYPPATVDAFSVARSQHSMRAGYHAAATAMQAVFPHMQTAQWGRIINIFSVHSAHQSTAGLNNAKEAVCDYIRTAAVEWAQYNITANIICPAQLSTPGKTNDEVDPMLAGTATASTSKDQTGAANNSIGDVALCLASDQSQYVTGNTILLGDGNRDLQSKN